MKDIIMEPCRELYSRVWNNTLGLYVDEDKVLRCKGRLQNAELTVQFNFPAFECEQSFPFTNTGVDYLGPVLVRQVYDDERTEIRRG